MVKKLSGFFQKFYLAIILLFMYLPILTLMIFSFNDSKTMGNWSGFTLRWYKDLFNNDRIMTALFFTIVIALISSVIATIIGTLAAVGIKKMKPRKRGLILNINQLPILNPDIVTGIALMSLFIFFRSFTPIEFGFTTMLLAHITFSIPYVILSVLPKLNQMSPNIRKAALDLGATPVYAFRKVVFPQIKSGVFAGFLMALTMSLDDFVISFFTTGPGVTNLSIEIYSMAKRGIKPEINALSTLMFVTVLVLLLIANKKSLTRGDHIEK